MSELADSALSSIDFDEVNEKDAGVPDLNADKAQLQLSGALSQVKLEWLDPNGSMVMSRGEFAQQRQLATI